MNKMNFRSLISAFAVLVLACRSYLSHVEATLCTPGNQSKFVGLKTSLKQVKNYYENPRNKFNISGTVEIVDGCKFVVKDFTFPSGLPATWYGKDQKETEGYRVIQGVIAPSNGEDKIFTLTDTPGSSYDWNDFDTLTIFHNDTVYAEAHFAELQPGSTFLSSQKGVKKPSSLLSNNNAHLSQSQDDKRKMNNEGTNRKSSESESKVAPVNHEGHPGMHEENGSTPGGSKEDDNRKSNPETGNKKPGSSSGALKTHFGTTTSALLASSGVAIFTILFLSGS